jgi:hypothetical protein
MGLARDRSGRVPFSMVAVLILIGSIVTGAYMQRVATDSGSGTVPVTGQGADEILPELRSEMESIAARCIEGAVDEQTDIGVGAADQGLWRVDQNFKAYFGQLVRGELGRRDFGRRCITVEAGNATVELSVLPMSVWTVNRLGMTVNMTVPAALRALGSVNFTIRPRGAPAVNRTVDFDVREASWYPFVLGQIDRMKRDCTDEGLVETLMKEMFKGYLEKCRIDLLARRNSSRALEPLYQLTVGDFWKKTDIEEPGFNAFDLALRIEEQILFGECRGKFFNGYRDWVPGRQLRIADTLDYPHGVFAGISAFHESADAGGMFLDTGLFHCATRAAPVGTTGLSPAFIPLSVDSRWVWVPEPVVEKTVFAGDDGSPDVYMFRFSVNGAYRLRVGPDSHHELEIDIPVHIEFHQDFRIPDLDGYPERGDLHCGIEDSGLFDSEFSGLYCTPVSLAVQVVNSTGVPAGALPGGCSLDIMLDGDKLGTFGPQDFGPEGLVIGNVPSGPHEFCAVLVCEGGGGPEAGTCQTSADAPSQRVEIRTAPASGTSQFWAYVLEYLRDVPGRLRLVKMLELFSLETGYAIPEEVRSITDNSAENARAIIRWVTGLDEFLETFDRMAECADSLQYEMKEGIRCAVKIVIETLTSIEETLSAAGAASAGGAARADGFESSLVYGCTERTQTMVFVVEWEDGQRTLAFEKPDGSRSWTAEIAGAEGSGAAGSWKQAGFEAAADVAATVALVATFYFKYMNYKATGGSIDENERIDLTLDVIKIAAELTASYLRFASRSLAREGAKAAAESVGVAAETLGLLVAVIFLIQSVRDESQQFRGDPEAWNALFTGLDQDTVMFYIDIAGVALFALEVLVWLGLAAGAAPFLLPLWGALALITLIAVMVFNWQAFSTMLSGVMAGDDRDRMAGSVRETLQDTAGTIAALNEFPSVECMFAARQSRGAAYLESNLAMFTADSRSSFEMANLSGYQYDLAWAKEHQARAPRNLRYFMIDLWEQVAELKGSSKDNFGRDQPWSGQIIIHEAGSGQSYNIDGDFVPQYLMGLNSTSVKGIRVDFEVKGNIVVEGLRGWMNALARIGDHVAVHNSRLSQSRAMSSYLCGLDGLVHREDWGYLQVRMSPSFTRCNVRISAPSPFEYYDGRSARSTTSLVQTVTGTGSPTSIYLTPGEYTVEFLDQAPDLELSTKRTTIKVFGLYSPDFCKKSVSIMPERRSIYFQVESRFNGSARLRVDVLDPEGNVVDGIGTVFEFDNTTNRTGKEYIDSSWVPHFCFDDSMMGCDDDQRYSLTLRIRFTVELDRGSDGTFERAASRTVPVNDIRNDQKAAMQKDNGKHDDQLGYRLVLLEEPLKEKYGETDDGQDLVREQYLQWTKVN